MLSNIAFFLLSASVLLLELAQARVFSVMLWHHLSYMVITIALLGFGCAGTLVSIFWKQFSRNYQKNVIICCCCFSLLIIFSFAAVTHLPLCTLQFTFFNLSVIFLYYLLFFLPYLAAGCAVAIMLSTSVKRINTLYCVNMIGSGAGCLLMIILIGPLGGEATITACAFLSSVAALLFAIKESKRIQITAAAISIVVILFTVFASDIFPVKPAPFKALSVYLNNIKQFPGFKVEVSKWNPISRIDVVSADNTTGQTHVLELSPKNKNLLVDGDAYTAIENHPNIDYLTGGKPAFHMYTIPYMIKKNPKVLIIGLGGGNDVFAAQLMGAEEITGCEINGITTDLIRKRYSKFTGEIYNKKNTKIYTAEGRSFVRRSKEKYDLIQMTSVDTWAGLSSGAYVLSENYLYSKDAFYDYLDHLNDDGMLCIIRLFFSPPREVLRLASTAACVLKEKGINKPSTHIAVVSVAGGGLAALLIKKSPFTEQEINILVNDRYYDPGAKIVYAPGRSVGDLNPGLSDEGLFHLKNQARPFFDLLRSWNVGKQSDFFESYPFDVKPVTDNSPFFFEFYKWKNFLLDIKGSGFGGWGGDTVRPVALLILGASSFQAVLISILFILAPIALFKKNTGAEFDKKFKFISYFICLGFAYMVLEIVFMQKLVLFLGHPIYSISVVLSSFLIFSGLGSLAAGRIRWGEKKIVLVSVATIVLYGTMLILGLQTVISSFLGFDLSVRALISWILLFPLAFFMGMPFPTGLKTASRLSPGLVPWAIGINACASVTASILIILIAMGIGFNAAMGTGLAVYAAALLCFMLIKFPGNIASNS